MRCGFFKVQGFRVLGFQGLGCRGSVAGFNFGFGRTKTTRNGTWGSICPCVSLQQCLKKQLKIEDWTKNEVKRKKEFRACSSKVVDKNGAKCNMAFGRLTKIYPFKKKDVKVLHLKRTRSRNSPGCTPRKNQRGPKRNEKKLTVHGPHCQLRRLRQSSQT